jgi:hypothetical protein
MSDAEHRDDEKKPPSRWARAWTFLNSPILLFVLTSVVLAYLSDRHVKLEAEAARQAARLAERSRLMIELEHRSEDIRVHVDRIVDLGEARSKAPVRVGCRTPLDSGSADALKVGVDLKAPEEVDALRELRAAVAGAPPYLATSPAYANIHTLVLMTQIDENFGDPISAKRVVWSVPRQVHATPPFRAADAVRSLDTTNLCNLIRNQELVERYAQIRSTGDCKRDLETSEFRCRLNLEKYAGED